MQQLSPTSDAATIDDIRCCNNHQHKLQQQSPTLAAATLAKIQCSNNRRRVWRKEGRRKKKGKKEKKKEINSFVILWDKEASLQILFF